jgi:hypothetical protein
MIPEPHPIGASRLSYCLSLGIGNGKHGPRPSPPLLARGGASGLDAYLGSRSECENLSAMAMCARLQSCNVAMEVGSAGLAGANPDLKFPSRSASQRYAQVIDITHVHLGAGAAMVQPFFFCASNHSIEPGAYTG